MANYYVKNGGSDAAAGTSDGTAWETLTKVSTYSASPGFAAGLSEENNLAYANTSEVGIPNYGSDPQFVDPTGNPGYS